MNKLFWGMLKILLVCVLVAAMTVGVFYLVQRLEWPWWSGVALLSALAGVIALIILIRRYALWRKEQQFVERIVAHDKSLIEQASENGRQRLHQLQQRWLEAIATLRHSRLRHRGNPLYALPWYLMLGETASGKSSAIAGAGLTSILSPVGPTPGNASTRNCDWWFFEQSIVIDSAGRYAVPLSAQEDEQEWHQFLALLAAYRRREPLNGIIVTLPAEKLLQPVGEALCAYGRYIGGRLNRLMQSVGVRIPVYLLVTKADQITGFVAYANSLNKNERRQGLGYTHPHPLELIPPVEYLLANISNKLQQGILHGDNRNNDTALLLATELNQLAEPLQLFVEAAFHHDNYHEPVMLRGLYFASACQPGKTMANALSDLADVGYQAQSNQGLFLHQLFAHLLPTDRHLYQPIQELLRWRTLTGQIVLLAVLLFSFATITWLGTHYIDSQKQVDQLQKTLTYAMTMNGSVEQEILALNALRQTILHFEEKRGRWSPLRSTLQQPVDQALSRARDYLVQRFLMRVLNPLEQRLLSQLNQLGSALPAVMVGDAAVHLSWLLEEIMARFAGQTMPRLQIHHQGWTRASRKLMGVDVEYQKELSLLYSAFITWQRDTQQLYDLASTTREALNWLLTLKNDWSWIIEWASDPTHLPTVKADTFWQFPVKDNASVPGAYTQQGRHVIEQLLKQLQAHSQRVDFSDRLRRFWNRYGLQYQQSWSQFLQNFPTTATQLKNSERRLIAYTLTLVDNPFFSLQRTAERELAAVADLVPLDLSALHLSNRIIEQQNSSTQSGAQGVLEQGEQLLAEAVASNTTHSPAYLEKITRGVKLCEQLQQSLKALIPSLQTEATAAKKVADLLTNVSTDEAAFKGWEAVTELRQLLVVDQPQVVGAQVFDHLYHFILATQLALTGHYLQEQWESNVYGALKYIAPEQQSTRLFSEGGLLTKFMDGPIKPFITRQADGWHPVSYQGLTVPFSAELFTFIEQGMRHMQKIQQEYRVNLKAIPLEVNDELLEKPLSAALTLQCATGPQQLVNYNYPISGHFDWHPQRCGEVLLEIRFSDLTLSKSWPGRLGLADFLADFRHGVMQFTPEQFPDEQSRLQQKKFKWLRVNYQLSDHQAILDQRSTQQLPIPLYITAINER